MKILVSIQVAAFIEVKQTGDTVGVHVLSATPPNVCCVLDQAGNKEAIEIGAQALEDYSTIASEHLARMTHQSMLNKMSDFTEPVLQQKEGSA